VIRTEILLEGTLKTLTHIRRNAKITPSSCRSWILFDVTVTALFFIVSSTIAYAGQVTLGWDKSTEPDVAGYKVYYGTATRNYTQSIKITSPNITTCTIIHLSLGQTYYFAATTYNSDLVESDYSAEISYNSTPAATTTTIRPTTTTIPGETTTTTTQPATCDILSILPSEITIGFGLIPRIKTITVTLDNDLEAAGITPGDLNFENIPKGITILYAQISGNSIKAVVLFWGVTPGTYNVNLGPCGSKPFVILMF
jgi:hypothetical protein